MSRAAFNRHLAQLRNCAECPGVESRAVTGAVYGARIMLVGQAPGPREPIEGKPFAYTAGGRLFGWFEQLGVSEARFRESVHIGAVIRCFPGKEPGGGDRVPSESEIANCGVHLDRELKILEPWLVIAVGTLASAQLVGVGKLDRAVGVIHQVTRAGVVFDVVVLPHPSGRSTWLNRPEHRRLFENSLALMQRHRAFAASFPEATSSPAP